MGIPARLAPVIAACLLLAGCTTPGSSGPSDTGTPEPTPTASETTAPAPEALVISLDGLTLLNDDESVAASATFDEGSAVLELLGSAFGSTPSGVSNEVYAFTGYEWEHVSLTVFENNSSLISVDAPEQSGVELHTTDGIAVGATRAEADSFAEYLGSDSDGDGLPDYLGLEARANTNYESLEHPGEPGTDFVSVVFQGDTVWRINSPSSDYSDI